MVQAKIFNIKPKENNFFIFIAFHLTCIKFLAEQIFIDKENMSADEASDPN